MLWLGIGLVMHKDMALVNGAHIVPLWPWSTCTT